MWRCLTQLTLFVRVLLSLCTAVVAAAAATIICLLLWLLNSHGSRVVAYRAAIYISNNTTAAIMAGMHDEHERLALVIRVRAVQIGVTLCR